MFSLFLLTQTVVFANWAHAGAYDTRSLVGFEPASYQRSTLPITQLSARSLYPRLPVCPDTAPVLCGYTEDGCKNTPIKSKFNISCRMLPHRR